MLLKTGILLILPCLVLGQMIGMNDPCWTSYSETYDSYGFCEAENCCEGGAVISNQCPSYPADWKCCYSRPKCNVDEGCSSGSCSSAQQSAACNVLRMHDNGRIRLKHNHFNSQGNNPYDGASSLSEVRDVCFGFQAKRSGYENAPGGCVCLQAGMLNHLADYAQSYYNDQAQPIDVNALAGSSHSVTSNHYRGSVFDVGCTSPTYHCTDLAQFCLGQSDINQVCWPQDNCGGGHDTWVHCDFYVD